MHFRKIVSYVFLLAFSVLSEVPTNGLVAYYPFNGNANDESGHGFNGTVNGATLAADRFDQPNSAYYFSGSSGISATVDTTLSLAEFTVAAWFESNASGSEVRLVSVTRPSQCNCYYGLLQDNNALMSMLLTDTNSSSGYTLNSSRSTTSQGTWHHGAITYANKVLKFYIDGALDDTVLSAAKTITQFKSSAALDIGFCPAGGRYTGKLDDIRIYNRVLSDAEIAALYHQGGLDTLVPPILIPVPSPTINRKPVFAWHSVTASTGYTIQIDTTRSFTNPMATIPLSDTSYTFPVDLPIKTIYWRVKAFNTDYSAYSSFIIQDTRVPFLIPFQPKITRETKPTLKWFTVSTATSYTIMIASNSSFTSPIAIVPLSDTTYFVSNALPLGKIFWKVASSLVSTYSSPDSFLIVSDTIPFLVRFNGATITAKRPTFQWYKVSSATSYDISIADNPSFTSALLIPVTDTSYIPTVDLGGMKYWRVSSSRNIALFSLYDSLRIDTTTTVISIGLKGSASKFSISYRNNSIMVTLPASFKGTATMSIFAISGKMIKSAQLMDSRDVSIDLRSGMYLIRVSNGSARFIEKLLVQ